MCNELKCAIQSTVDLINININRDVSQSLEQGNTETRNSINVWLYYPT